MGAGCSRSSSSSRGGAAEEEDGAGGCCCRGGGAALDDRHSRPRWRRGSIDSDDALGEFEGGFDYTLPLERDVGSPAAAGRKQTAAATRNRHATSSMADLLAGGVQPSSFDVLYGRYLPFVVRERFLSAALVGRSTQPQCELECFDAAICFVDISGFTRLSEELVNLHGSNGAEILNEIISGYFEKLIDVIVDFGGESGDAAQARTERSDQIIWCRR